MSSDIKCYLLKYWKQLILKNMYRAGASNIRQLMKSFWSENLQKLLRVYGHGAMVGGSFSQNFLFLGQEMKTKFRPNPGLVWSCVKQLEPPKQTSPLRSEHTNQQAADFQEISSHFYDVIALRKFANLTDIRMEGGQLVYSLCNGILVPMGTSFGLRRRSGKTYNVGWCGYAERRKECVGWHFEC